jgi:hypothetical protein
MRVCGSLLIILMVLSRQVHAGEISGTPAMVPPETLGDFSSLWTNNVINSGFEPDEYRTHQLGLQFDISPRWGLVFDYSILTADKNNPVLQDFTGRLDEMSLSLMHELYRDRPDSNNFAILEMGAGIRTYGDFDGNRIQNGFHRLINNGVDYYPYLETETNMAIFLLKGDYQKLYPLPLSKDTKNTWQAGYWLGATGLVSTESQWDAALSANAVIRNQTMAFWLGLREDWRENYELDFVQQATALTESGTSLTFGIGAGPVVFEMVQGFGDKLSYSRLILTSVENEYASAGYSVQADNAVALNFLLPDIELELQYRRALNYQPEYLGRPKTWFVIEMHYGEPTYEESFDVNNSFQQDPTFSIYSEIHQIAIGVEFEWHKQHYFQRVWPYLTLLAGQRTEKLKADSGTLAGQESEKASSTVFEVSSGVRLDLYSWEKGQFLFQAGVVGNYPLSSETVTFGQNDLELLQPNLTLSLGFSLNFGF